MEIALPMLYGVRMGNAALGGLVGAYLGAMVSPDSLAMVAAGAGIGTSAGLMLHPLDMLSGTKTGVSFTKSGENTAKEALIAAALFYVSPFPEGQLLKGAAMGALASVITTLM